MSAQTALSPSVAPASAPSPRRHIRIAPSADQRRARPKTLYAVVTVASLGVIFAAQLLLSIVVSNGAYEMSALNGEQRELLQTEQALQEKIEVLDSAQNLATNAAGLGMIQATSPQYLRLSDVTVSAGPTIHNACAQDCTLVPNELLAGVPLAGVDAPVADTPTAGTPVAGEETAPAVNQLPVPVTR